MTYEPKPGVLTEEDKARLVLGNTGHDVDVGEILETVFTAVEKNLEDQAERADEAEAAIPKTEDLSETQKEVLESQTSTMEQMTDAPETGGPSSHIDGNPLDGDKGEGDTESAHAAETSIASNESDDREGADEPLADPVENKTAEPDAGKLTPGLYEGTGGEGHETAETGEGNGTDAEAAHSTESTPSSVDEAALPDLADSTDLADADSEPTKTDGVA